MASWANERLCCEGWQSLPARLEGGWEGEVGGWDEGVGGKVIKQNPTGLRLLEEAGRQSDRLFAAGVSLPAHARDR